MNEQNKLISIFNQVEDPRSHINKLHKLVDILLIGIISVLCGAETWKQMIEFAKSKEEFLSTFLELPNGIPSEDTINRVFSSIDGNQLENCFIEWVNSIADLSLGQIIAIDGKTIRGAKHKGKKSPIYMVSAWACENNLVLGQIKTDEKSNEFTAIPNLLDILDIAENTVSIDVMGNQAQLLEDIQDEFRFSKQIEINKDGDLGHGRIETRICSVITDFQFIENQNEWKI